MIIGVDHIALSTSDIDKAIKAIEAWGYRPKFVDRNLPNDAVKVPYLENPDKFHDISFCQLLIPNPAIELTAYRGRVEVNEDSPFKAVFSGKNPDRGEVRVNARHLEIAAIASEAFEFKVEPVWLSDFGTTSYYLHETTAKGAGCACIKSMILDSPDIEQTSNLWLNLGFTLKKESTVPAKARWRLLEYKSYLPVWSLTLLIINSNYPRNGVYKLDMPGFTCIALLTNNIAVEAKRLREEGIKVSESFLLRTGGNLLKICLCYGKCGECIELIEFVRESKYENN